MHQLLYPKVVDIVGPQLAPKITGMLLDFEVLSVQDILEMLEDNTALSERVNEAQDSAEFTVDNIRTKLDDFFKLNVHKQRKILHQLLFPKVALVARPQSAPAITCLLTDLDVLSVQDILELLENYIALIERVVEAQIRLN